MTSAPSPGVASESELPTATAHSTRPAKQRSKLGAAWVSLATFAVVLVLLIVFILENPAKTPISYFGATGHLQLGILVLLSAIAGVVLTLLLGSLRIVQLKVRQRHQS